MKVEFFNDLSRGVSAPDEVIEVDEVPMRAILSIEADKSDPLNQICVVGFKYGNIGARIFVEREPAMPIPIGALSVILQTVLDRAELIRTGV